MTNQKIAIGQLKLKVTKYCTICQCSTKRILIENVYENNEIEIEKAKEILKNKFSKKYTCRICQSILKQVN